MDEELIKRLAIESGMMRENWMTNPPTRVCLWTGEEGIQHFASLIAEECATLSGSAAIRDKFSIRSATAKNLRYDIQTAHVDCNETRHPQAAMQAMGVTYYHATPSSMGACWWFWICEGMPAELPKFLTELDFTPEDAIGHGLSPDKAKAIRARMPT